MTRLQSHRDEAMARGGGRLLLETLSRLVTPTSNVITRIVIVSVQLASKALSTKHGLTSRTVSRELQYVLMFAKAI